MTASKIAVIVAINMSLRELELCFEAALLCPSVMGAVAGATAERRDRFEIELNLNFIQCSGT